MDAFLQKKKKKEAEVPQENYDDDVVETMQKMRERLNEHLNKKKEK